MVSDRIASPSTERHPRRSDGTPSCRAAPCFPKKPDVGDAISAIHKHCRSADLHPPLQFGNRSEFVRIKILSIDRERDPTPGPDEISLTFNEPWLKAAREIFDTISKP